MHYRDGIHYCKYLDAYWVQWALFLFGVYLCLYLYRVSFPFGACLYLYRVWSPFGVYLYLYRVSFPFDVCLYLYRCQCHVRYFVRFYLRCLIPYCLYLHAKMMKHRARCCHTVG